MEPGYFAEDKYGNDLTEQVFGHTRTKSRFSSQYAPLLVVDQDGSFSSAVRHVNIYNNSPLYLSKSTYFKTGTKPYFIDSLLGELIISSDNLYQTSDGNLSNTHDISYPFTGIFSENDQQVSIEAGISWNKCQD